MPELVLHVETCEFLFPSPGGDVVRPSETSEENVESEMFPSPGGDVLCRRTRAGADGR